MTALSGDVLDHNALEVFITCRLADHNRVTQDLEVVQVALASIDETWEAARRVVAAPRPLWFRRRDRDRDLLAHPRAAGRTLGCRLHCQCRHRLVLIPPS